MPANESGNFAVRSSTPDIGSSFGDGLGSSSTSTGSLIALSVESSPVHVFPGETFSIRLWAEYPERFSNAVESISCVRLARTWSSDHNGLIERLTLEGPLDGVVSNGHAITFEGNRFTPHAADRSWTVGFRLFINGQFHSEAWCVIEVEARSE